MSIRDIVNQYALSRAECIPLVASENSVSKSVKLLCAAGVGERYCVGPVAPWRYPREAYLEEIVFKTSQLAAKLFGGKATTVAPLSGSQCVAAIVLGMCKPGDLVIGLSAADGGHWALRGMADKLQCEFEPLPLANRTEVDCRKLDQIIQKRRPKFVMVDPSHSLQAIAPEQIRSVLPTEIPLFYDISHFMGLVPHKYLQNPFSRGVTVLHGSTHKSFFGPQKGLIVFGQEAAPEMVAQISVAAEKILSSNTHLHHVAALGQALEEYEAFGEAYAETVVKHARLFAQALKNQGLSVLAAQHSLTESHQVLVGIDGSAESIWNGLTAAGILTNLIRLPQADALGFRFGLAEVTRLGYTMPEIEKVASMVANLINNPCDFEYAKMAIKELSSRPRSMKFCFEGSLSADAKSDLSSTPSG